MLSSSDRHIYHPFPSLTSLALPVQLQMAPKNGDVGAAKVSHFFDTHCANIVGHLMPHIDSVLNHMAQLVVPATPRLAASSNFTITTATTFSASTAGATSHSPLLQRPYNNDNNKSNKRNDAARCHTIALVNALRGASVDDQLLMAFCCAVVRCGCCLDLVQSMLLEMLVNAKKLEQFAKMNNGIVGVPIKMIAISSGFKFACSSNKTTTDENGGIICSNATPAVVEENQQKHKHRKHVIRFYSETLKELLREVDKMALILFRWEAIGWQMWANVTNEHCSALKVQNLVSILLDAPAPLTLDHICVALLLSQQFNLFSKIHEFADSEQMQFLLQNSMAALQQHHHQRHKKQLAPLENGTTMRGDGEAQAQAPVAAPFVCTTGGGKTTTTTNNSTTSAQAPSIIPTTTSITTTADEDENDIEQTMPSAMPSAMPSSSSSLFVPKIANFGDDGSGKMHLLLDEMPEGFSTSRDYLSVPTTTGGRMMGQQQSQLMAAMPTDLITYYNANKNEFYPNFAHPRGLALVISNYRFMGGMQAREGTHMDRENIVNLLKQLNYKVLIRNDLTSKEMMWAMKEFAQQNEAHQRANSAIVVVLSHGEYDTLLGTDEVGVNLYHFVAQLNAHNCPHLSGKPKIFFIQACRGDIKDTGVLMEVPIEAAGDDSADGLGPSKPSLALYSPSSSNNNNKRGPLSFFSRNNGGPRNSNGNLVRMSSAMALPFQQLRNGEWTSSSSSSSAMPKTKFVKEPTNADILIAQSTTAHYVSWRNSARGTWFVQSLCKVFSQWAAKEDILQMLTRVHAEVSTIEGSTAERAKQVPEMCSTLRKRFYFFPHQQQSTAAAMVDGRGDQQTFGDK